jgi:hypothetical protein
VQEIDLSTRIRGKKIYIEILSDDHVVTIFVVFYDSRLAAILAPLKRANHQNLVKSYFCLFGGSPEE